MKKKKKSSAIHLKTISHFSKFKFNLRKMELQKGFPLLIQQYKALLFKNLLLSWRNKRSTFLQLFSSLFFIFIIFCIQKAIESRYASSSSFKSINNPEPLIFPSIPPCEEKFYSKLPCFDFVWSGNDSARIGEIVRRIRENNPGRSIPSDKVQSFKTQNEVDDWLANNPMHCPGALHFVDRNAAIISYGLQTNSTPVSKRGSFEDPTFKFQIPLQLAAEREIARSLIGDASFSWVVSLKEFAHPSLEIFSAVQTVGPTFFLAIAMFAFVFQVAALITEKELKLRQAMTIMGLYDTAYWLSWLTWEGIITFVSSLFTVLFGMMFQFDFFLHNSFGVVFFLFFLFQLNMTAFAFMLSAFISKSSSSTTVGYSIFIVGFMTQLVTAFGFPYSDNFSNTYRIVWSFFPPNLLAQGLQLLSDATTTPQDPGVSWNGRTKCSPNDTECIVTINEIYIWLLATSFVWFVLAVYFDNVIPNTSGVRKSMFYFLSPRYWTGNGGNKIEEGSICSCFSSVPLVESTVPDDEDVLEEENIVKQQASEGSIDSRVAVQIRGLVKTYAGATKISCCKCTRTSPYHALKGLWVNFPTDQLFCLLGPNGAGKTTAINCLTGITPVTGGDALIYGYSVRSSTGMSNIRRMIGVCPQFDILWDGLSGQEHLYLFASVKGLPPASIEEVVQKLLAEVKLTEAAKTRAGSYSGGMRRRLSVAIALIGEPKLVILDEPTTGMDPVTRRHVWDVIEEAKKGRAIVLTTHSMEEADILSDRIGIMAKGKLRCVGTSIRLKSRFGTGFIANISFFGDANGNPNRGDTFNTSQHEAVKQFFKVNLDITPKEENRSFLTFVIPHEKEKHLTKFFEELQEKVKEYGIADIQLGLTTLEEVFLNIVKQAELESATAEGSYATLTLNSGVSVQVPIGARFVVVPGTESTENPRGIMVEVYWEQDDAGALCISGHSNEMPIPPHVQLRESSTPTSSINILGRRQKIRGIVIDPAQITNSSL
ncbi:ABC transporter A family member 2 [Olea europaea subsp. europaea]|uniref:ABC transporter A family member 2 n=2 Tax=Olea europaea subsp. europaea TaxID=158383 RepID=A0A8S0Q7K2_OLEEU|nr:ABC transporter A family member 2 [Olea europaea subsp. europaea]